MKKRTQLAAILLALIMATSSLSACGAQDGTVLNANASQKTVTENEKSTQETSDYISDIILDAEESTGIEFSENVSDEESSEAEIEKVYTKADVDGNGKITADDYILLKRAIFGFTKFNDEQNIAGDLNNNNELDPTDYIWLKRIYFGTAKLEDILNTKPVEDELSEDVSEEDSGVIIESSEEESSEYIEENSETESIPEESSEIESEPSESEPAESEIESIESAEAESSEPMNESSEAVSSEEPVESSVAVSSEPIEESSEEESSIPSETIPEESEPVEDDPFAKFYVSIDSMSLEEAEALIEECILMYINKYRVEEGKCEMTMLDGKSRAFARGRSVQLTENFAHDTADIRSLATELEYGTYVPSHPETKYDRETGTIIYTGNMTEPYYNPAGGEAISEVIATSIAYICDVAESSAAGIFNSKAHWEYIGGANSDRIAIGVTLYGGHAFICYLNMDANDAALYD